MESTQDGHCTVNDRWALQTREISTKEKCKDCQLGQKTKERHVVEMIAGKGSLEMYVLTMVEMKK